MASITSCVDQDRNIKFDQPAGWDVDVSHAVEGGTNLLAIWSPAAPGGGPGVLVTVDVVRHGDGDLLTHVTDRLQYQAKRENYVLRGRSSGRHSATGRPAINVTYDVRLDTTINRVEMTFIEAADGLVISASALCPLADRRLWREGCRVIFGSLRLADPDRPPMPGVGRYKGVGLPPGCSPALQRLWQVLDHWAQQIVVTNREVIRRETGLLLGPAAHFEARVYLAYELMLAMYVAAYPTAGTQAVNWAVRYAITGADVTEPIPPASPHARFLERLEVYAAGIKAEPKYRFHSKIRALQFAELLTTSGMGNSPAAINPPVVVERRDLFTPEKGVVYDSFLHVVSPFVRSALFLFKGATDIDEFDEAETDRRLQAAYDESEKVTRKLMEAG